MALDDVVRQLVHGAGRDVSASIEHAEVLAHAPRERQLLLDEQDRQAALLVQADQHVADLMHDVRLDAFGRLVEDQEPRSEHERASDRELLLLAAGERAGVPTAELMQDREQLVCLGEGVVAVSPTRGGEPEALLDGMEQDLGEVRIPSAEALLLYCYRAAGVVSRMPSMANRRNFSPMSGLTSPKKRAAIAARRAQAIIDEETAQATSQGPGLEHRSRREKRECDRVRGATRHDRRCGRRRRTHRSIRRTAR